MYWNRRTPAKKETTKVSVSDNAELSTNRRRRPEGQTAIKPTTPTTITTPRRPLFANRVVSSRIRAPPLPPPPLAKQNVKLTKSTPALSGSNAPRVVNAKISVTYSKSDKVIRNQQRQGYQKQPSRTKKLDCGGKNVRIECARIASRPHTMKSLKAIFRRQKENGGSSQHGDDLSRASSISNLNAETASKSRGALAKVRKSISKDRLDNVAVDKKLEKKSCNKNNNQIDAVGDGGEEVGSLQQKLEVVSSEKGTLMLQLGEQRGQLSVLQKEISRLKMFQDQSSMQLEQLNDENAALRNKLRDVVHSPLSDNEKQMLLLDSQRHHSSAPASIAANLLGGDGGGEGTTPDWDKQSSSNVSDVSVACLQDKINQMQETHYSTNEELQATLQELTDLQRQLSELQQDNEHLLEEKNLMFDSLCRQTERLNDARGEMDSLKQLLYREKDDTSGGQYESVVEREQKLVDLLKGAQEEREMLLVKQEQINNEIQDARTVILQRENENLQLGDRVRTLESTLDAKHAEHKQLDQEMARAKDKASSRQIEIDRLTDLLENARTKIIELEQDRELSDKSELDELLDNTRKEKDALESEVAHMKEQIARGRNETEKLREQVSILQEECKVLRNNAKCTQSELEYKVDKLNAEKASLVEQLQRLEEAANELQVQIQCQLEDKRQLSSVLSETQRNMSEVERCNLDLEGELKEVRKLRNEENEEWDKFQNDLLTSVRVANDFKTEAQQELQKLIMENKAHRDKIRQLESQLEKMKDTLDNTIADIQCMKDKLVDVLTSHGSSSRSDEIYSNNLIGDHENGIKKLEELDYDDLTTRSSIALTGVMGNYYNIGKAELTSSNKLIDDDTEMIKTFQKVKTDEISTKSAIINLENKLAAYNRKIDDVISNNKVFGDELELLKSFKKTKIDEINDNSSTIFNNKDVGTSNMLATSNQSIGGGKELIKPLNEVKYDESSSSSKSSSENEVYNRRSDVITSDQRTGLDVEVIKKLNKRKTHEIPSISSNTTEKKLIGDDLEVLQKFRKTKIDEICTRFTNVGSDDKLIGSNNRKPIVFTNNQLIDDDLKVTGDGKKVVGGDKMRIGSYKKMIGGDKRIIGDDTMIVDNKNWIGYGKKVIGDDEKVYRIDTNVLGDDKKIVGEDQKLIGDDAGLTGGDLEMIKILKSKNNHESSITSSNINTENNVIKGIPSSSTTKSTSSASNLKDTPSSSTPTNFVAAINKTLLGDHKKATKTTSKKQSKPSKHDKEGDQTHLLVINEEYSKINPSIPFENLEPSQQFIMKLKRSYDSQLGTTKAKPVANRIKSQLAISKPLLSSVYDNPTLREIAENNSIASVEEDNSVVVPQDFAYSGSLRVIKSKPTSLQKKHSMSEPNLASLYSKIDLQKPSEMMSQEEKFVVHLKQSLDVLGRKNTLKKRRVAGKKLLISNPDVSSVLRNDRLAEIVANPGIGPVRKVDILKSGKKVERLRGVERRYQDAAVVCNKMFTVGDDDDDDYAFDRKVLRYSLKSGAVRVEKSKSLEEEERLRVTLDDLRLRFGSTRPDLIEGVVGGYADKSGASSERFGSIGGDGFEEFNRFQHSDGDFEDFNRFDDGWDDKKHQSCPTSFLEEYAAYKSCPKNVLEETKPTYHHFDEDPKILDVGGIAQNVSKKLDPSFMKNHTYGDVLEQSTSIEDQKVLEEDQNSLEEEQKLLPKVQKDLEKEQKVFDKAQKVSNRNSLNMPPLLEPQKVLDEDHQLSVEYSPSSCEKETLLDIKQSKVISTLVSGHKDDDGILKMVENYQLQNNSSECDEDVYAESFASFRLHYKDVVRSLKRRFNRSTEDEDGYDLKGREGTVIESLKVEICELPRIPRTSLKLVSVSSEDLKKFEDEDEGLRKVKALEVFENGESEARSLERREFEGVDEDLIKVEVVGEDVGRFEGVYEGLKKFEAIDDDMKKIEGVDDDLRKFKGADEDLRNFEVLEVIKSIAPTKDVEKEEHYSIKPIPRSILKVTSNMTSAVPKKLTEKRFDDSIRSSVLEDVLTSEVEEGFSYKPTLRRRLQIAFSSEEIDGRLKNLNKLRKYLGLDNFKIVPTPTTRFRSQDKDKAIDNEVKTNFSLEELEVIPLKSKPILPPEEFEALENYKIGAAPKMRIRMADGEVYGGDASTSRGEYDSIAYSENESIVHEVEECIIYGEDESIAHGDDESVAYGEDKTVAYGVDESISRQRDLSLYSEEVEVKPNAISPPLEFGDVFEQNQNHLDITNADFVRSISNISEVTGGDYKIPKKITPPENFRVVSTLLRTAEVLDTASKLEMKKLELTGSTVFGVPTKNEESKLELFEESPNTVPDMMKHSEEISDVSMLLKTAKKFEMNEMEVTEENPNTSSGSIIFGGATECQFKLNLIEETMKDEERLKNEEILNNDEKLKNEEKSKNKEESNIEERLNGATVLGLVLKTDNYLVHSFVQNMVEGRIKPQNIIGGRPGLPNRLSSDGIDQSVTSTLEGRLDTSEEGKDVVQKLSSSEEIEVPIKLRVGGRIEDTAEEIFCAEILPSVGLELSTVVLTSGPNCDVPLKDAVIRENSTSNPHRVDTDVARHMEGGSSKLKSEDEDAGGEQSSGAVPIASCPPEHHGEKPSDDSVDIMSVITKVTPEPSVENLIIQSDDQQEEVFSDSYAELFKKPEDRVFENLSPVKERREFFTITVGSGEVTPPSQKPSGGSSEKVAALKKRFEENMRNEPRATSKPDVLLDCGPTFHDLKGGATRRLVVEGTGSQGSEMTLAEQTLGTPTASSTSVAGRRSQLDIGNRESYEMAKKMFEKKPN